MALKFEKAELVGAKFGTRFPLGDVIDTDQLVTRHELRKRGIDPAKIILETADIMRTLTLAATVPTAAGRARGARLGLVYVPSAVENMDAEDFYVMVAHETAHMTRPAEKLLASQAAIDARAVAHKDDPEELDAQIWEARQATKFEWDDERYRLYVDRVYGAVTRTQLGLDISSAAPEDIERLGPRERRWLQVVREEAEGRPASFATMRRRVRVRGHVRRG